MKTLTEQELQSKIDGFLAHKSSQFPDLGLPQRDVNHTIKADARKGSWLEGFFPVQLKPTV